MIGRRQELGSLRQRLTGTWRLVTLTGPGGIGKSCLARTMASELERVFEDGSVVVDLDEVTESALLTAAVSRAVGVHLQGELGDVDDLTTVLGDREVLLVLDGCDRLLEACADLVATVLARCPRMRVLATGRQPLRLAGECVQPLEPLGCPEPGALTVANASSYDAVALFVQRARGAVPSFALTDDNVEAVGEICTALGGVPLALELAAARVLVLSPQDIAERLTDRYRLLTKGARGASRSQQSLRASVEASHDLCEPAERTLWARLSVFTGSFDLEAVEAVCSGEGVDEWEVLDLIDSLLERSVLVRDDDDGSTVRYRMLETIRSYGDERLEPTERTQWQRRHLEWYAALAARSCAEWFGDRQVAWCRRLHRETPNLQAALDRATRDPETAPTALQLVCDLEAFWVVTGRVGEGRRWIDRAITAAGGCRQPEVQAHRADLATAQSVTQSVAHTAEVPVPVQGPAAQRGGPSTGLDPLLEARVLAVGAGLATISGELGQVRSLVEAAGRLVEHHALKDHALTAAVRRAEGTALFWEGDTQAGRRLLETAVRTSARGGDRYGEALGVLALGMCLLHGGDRRGGEQALRDAVALGEAAGDVHVRSYALGLLALGAAETGDWATADSAARETLGMRAALGDDFGVSFALELLGCASAHRQEAERAAVLFGAAETWRRAVGLAEQTVAGLEELREAGRTTARAALGARRFDAEVRRGHDLTKEQSIRFARDGEPLAGGATRSAAAEPVEDDVPLTPREAEVAQLVGQGLSNREIAEKLVISHRTAQGHVEHILRKLGFTSRTQVAAWVAERQARSMLR